MPLQASRDRAEGTGRYVRYRIQSAAAADLTPPPPRFRVTVRKLPLARLLARELIAYRGNLGVVLSRPCVYGVFSGPLGGFAPREGRCVGCLRCTVQYPDIVRIEPNPERDGTGNPFLGPDDVDALLYEARTGHVPVRGAGYRGRFGGEGWDGIWTDMSEIVRPTRDGIHGRETIATDVDIGQFPQFLRFDAAGEPRGPFPRFFTIQVPFFFDLLPRSVESPALYRVLADAARRLDTLALVPAALTADPALQHPHVVPVVPAAASSRSQQRPAEVAWHPRMLLLDGWDRERFAELGRRFPGSLVCVRAPADSDILTLVRGGARLLHLEADYQGHAGGGFAGDSILRAHRLLVEQGLREEVTLLGAGGIARAEHLAKAILCGLDAGGVDLAAVVALGARLQGTCRDRESSRLVLPRFDPAWGRQRLVNLAASWRDQLLEVLGAMGLREVRRLRGETGRALFQADLEREAFAGVPGYAPRA